MTEGISNQYPASTLFRRITTSALRLRDSSAAHNLLWQIAERAVRLILGVLVGFWVGRYLGPASFGTLSYAIALVAIAQSVAEAGVDAVLKREFLRQSEASSLWLRVGRALRLKMAVGCSALLVLWVVFGETKKDARVILAVLSVTLFSPAVNISALWLEANLQAKKLAMISLVAAFFGALFRITFILTEAPVWAFAVAVVVEMVVSAILVTSIVSKQLKDGPLATRAFEAKKLALWRESWPLLLSGLTVMLYLRIDMVMVQKISGSAAAGIYAAAVRFSELGFFLPGAIAASILPALLRAKSESVSRYRERVQFSFDVQVGFALLITIPTVILAPRIIAMTYGETFRSAASILVVNGWTLIWAGLGVSRGQYCVNEGFVRLHLISTAIGAALNVSLNCVLIPRFGAIGAAWATLAAQIVAAWLSSFLFRSLRSVGAMQARALLIPFRWYHYVR